MPTYTYDHIHLRTRNERAMADYFHEMFAPEVAMTSSPPDAYLGLDHFGFRVDDVDATVAELRRRGADIASEPHTIRPGVRVAFVRAPDNVRIELLQRN